MKECHNFFNPEHRANLIYLSHVLTSDGQAVDMSTSEKRVHVLTELNMSLFEGGVILIVNPSSKSGIKENELKEAGLQVVHEEDSRYLGEIIFLQKIDTKE